MKAQHEVSGRVRLTCTGSLCGRRKSQRQCLAGLGLRRIGQVSVLEDTPAVRGLITKVAFLLQVEEMPDE